jgi:hypothetical protein
MFVKQRHNETGLSQLAYITLDYYLLAADLPKTIWALMVQTRTTRESAEKRGKKSVTRPRVGRGSLF